MFVDSGFVVGSNQEKNTAYENKKGNQSRFCPKRLPRINYCSMECYWYKMVIGNKTLDFSI